MNTKEYKMPIGLEIIGDLSGCDDQKLKILNVKDVTRDVNNLIIKYGFTELGSFYHQFDIGLTGVIALAESHVTFHTWPEHGYVSLNVYVCNYTRNNENKAQLLFNSLTQLFFPESVKILKIKRQNEE